MESTEKLKPKERRVLEYINAAIDEKGYPPSVRDICAAMGLRSTSTAQMYVKRLVEKGYFVKQDGTSRTISRAEADEGKRYRVPLLGTVAAGLPILASEHLEGFLTFSSEHTYEPSKLFCLRVKGESMIEAGIMDGDIVVVEQRETAGNGEIVVAMVDDEATVKRFFKENGVFRLQPENRAMRPIIVPEVTILGKVIASMRYYA